MINGLEDLTQPSAVSGFLHNGRRMAMLAAAAFVLAFSWLFRFNDPGGSFAGLTDDHFFYLVRGWQILFGDLPVRDFVDHGAPLYYYVGAAVQALFGRGTLSELVFSTTAIAVGAALTFWLAARASGSVVLGLLGVAFQIFLSPRFYNYPKILAYATAIPALWWFAERPSARSRSAIAVATVVWFLFRHDHGLFIAAGMLALLLLNGTMSWRERAQHAVMYAATVLVLLAPYLIFIQRNGGVLSYFRQASAWAERDRGRAPVVWPSPFENTGGSSDLSRQTSGVERVTDLVRDNSIAWIYYAELVIPFFALFVLAVSRDGFRPSWPRARAKLATVAVIAIVLDAGFLRSPLEARLADPTVPLAILVAWLGAALPRMLFGTGSLRPAVQRRPWIVRGVAVMVGSALAFVIGVTVSKDLYDRLDSAALTERPGKAFERVGHVARQLREDWTLEAWMRRSDRPDLINLSLYVNACTDAGDRVLVQPYVPQVLALARRAFAGGHADLRPGFFRTEEAQRLTIARLERQSVPLILLETDDSYRHFRDSFPLVTAYIDERYRLAGTHTFDGRFGITLFVRLSRAPRGVWEPLGWPCYGSGRVASW